MRELPKWLGGWIARLLPKQKVQGDSAVQFGRVGGNVTIVNVTQHLPPAHPVPVPPMNATASFGEPSQAGFKISDYRAPPQPTWPQLWSEPVVPSSSPRKGTATEEQRKVLQLMRYVPNQSVVLDFMQREFGTRTVIELAPLQLYRVRRYVETISRRAGTPGMPKPAQGKPE